MDTLFLVVVFVWFLSIAVAYFTGAANADYKWMNKAGCKDPIEKYGEVFFVCKKKSYRWDFLKGKELSDEELDGYHSM